MPTKQRNSKVQHSAQARRSGLLVWLTPAALAITLAACGGKDPASTTQTGTTESPANAAPPQPQTLSGTVAVGAPITDGKLRILDAAGNTVAADLAVAADGSYAPVNLTGTGPWRLQACGMVGANYECFYAVASASGTANVTPLTSATVLLAAGQTPDGVMAGTLPSTLTSTALTTAQTTLRTGLAGVLTDAGVSSSMDFLTTPLAAGSRTGYDRVLDAIAVNSGVDQGAFVQITPRMGSGSLYVPSSGASSGSLNVDSRAANLSLSGVDTLFRDMTRALASATACASGDTAMRNSMSTDAFMDIEGERATGPDAMASMLCGFFAGMDGMPAMWGAQFLSPTLGRCDLSGSAPICRISFVIKTTDGAIMQVSEGMAVTHQGGAWKFRGAADAISIHAGATVQRDRRVDSTGTADRYSRALSFDIPAQAGLACASVSQRNASGDAVLLGYYKRQTGASNQRRLSAWRVSEFSNEMSTSRTAGFIRSTDDTWMTLPEGEAGDSMIRNFYRGGRTVQVSLFSNADCTTAFVPEGGRSHQFEVDVTGVPPVASAMAGLAWPDLSAATVTALTALTMDSGASTTLEVNWSFRHGPMGFGEASVCGDRGTCGEGGSGRIGEKELRSSVTSTTFNLRNQGPALNTQSSKMIALYGRTGDGLSVQSNYLVCPSAAAGSHCQ